MYSQLIKLKDKVLDDYRRSPHRIVADYKNETAITKDYDSRQLLEMLQNADDAKSSKVEIQIDTHLSVIRICNIGNPFSYEGFESLMIPNYSSKTDGVNIGNKGLGFRSILNWMNSLSVFSCNCKLTFSSVHAQQVLNDVLDNNSVEIEELNKRGGFALGTRPFPIMAAAEIEEISTPSPWTTVIEMNYEVGKKEAILNQVQVIREEILLFLNHIREIEVIVDGDVVKSYQAKVKEYQDYKEVSIGEKEWKVFEKNDEIPDFLQDKTKSYKQTYQLKLAFQDDLSDDYPYLFNYFPTKVKIHLPCILHGTFELNNSRDYLNDSDLNKFVIAEYNGLFKEAIDYLKKIGISWLPYQLVTPESTITDSTILPILYNNLEELRASDAIFPCFDEQYRTTGDWYAYDHSFQAFMFEHFKNHFPKLLIPNQGFKNLNKMDNDMFRSIINNISNTTLPIGLRADLISTLVNDVTVQEYEDLKLDILVNANGKLIPSSILAFTPILNNSYNFDLPQEIVEIDFISSPLYYALNDKFKSSYKRNEPDSRELQRIIKEVCNVQPYDSSNLIDKVITSFKQYLNNLSDQDKIESTVKLMVKTLFSIYNKIDRKTETLLQVIPLLNKNNELIDGNQLYLGESYKNERIITYCYDGYLSNKDYLKETSFWEIESEEIDDFFIWLGVNSFLKTQAISLSGKWEYQDYFDLIKREQPVSTDFNMGRISQKTTVTKIVDLKSIVEAISKEKFLLLVYFETKVRSLVLDNDENIYWSFSNSGRVIKTMISFINYQLIQSKIFEDLLLQSFSADILRFLNHNLFNYNELNDFGIDNPTINALLSKLGAKVSFHEMTVKRIYEVIGEIPNIDKENNGKGTATLYLKLIEALVEKNITSEEIANYFPLKLFGKLGDQQGYFSNLDLKYVSNAIFSNQILSTIPLVNLPKRYNEVNILKYFGVASLKESDIQILQDSIQESKYNASFALEFEKYKPYLLAYRLFSSSLRKPINEDSQRIDESNLLKRLNIILVDKLEYRFNNVNYQLKAYDFISKNHKYYILIPNSIGSIQEFLQNSFLCDALAEILCVQFKISELKSDFRFVIKNDLMDTQHIVKQEFAEYFDVIQGLMGPPAPMLDFWTNVFNLLKLVPSENVLKNELVMEDYIASYVGKKIDVTSIDYKNFGTKNSYDVISHLVKRSGLSLRDIRKEGLKEWHIRQLEESFYEHERFIDFVIWKKYSDSVSHKFYMNSLRNIKYKLKSDLQAYFIQNEEEVYQLEICYNDIIAKCLIDDYRKLYLEQLKIDKSELDEPNVLYNSLLKKYNIDQNELDIEVHSLLYFKDNDAQLERLFSELNANPDTTITDLEDIDYENAVLIDTVNIEASDRDSKYKKNESKPNYIHKSSKDERNKSIGKVAEKVAFNALKKKYGKDNVRWQSSNSDTPDKSDSLHYDILYKNELGDWKKLEVKSFNGRYFKISKDELNLGLENPEDFEIGLVENEKLYILKKLFQFEENESLERNKSFTIEANNYTIYYTKKS